MNKIENQLRQNIRIDENTHQYFLNDEVVDLLSVSKIIQLIEKYVFNDRFAQSEKGAEILKASILRGNHLHKIAETFLKNNKIEKCCEIFSHTTMKSYLIKELKELKSKYNEKDGWEIISELSIIGKFYLGTMDFLVINSKTKEFIIGDLKTTKKLNKEKEALQINFYKELLKYRLEQINEPEYKCAGFFVINCNTDNFINYDLTKKEIELAEIETKIILKKLQ